MSAAATRNKVLTRRVPGKTVDSSRPVSAPPPPAKRPVERKPDTAKVIPLPVAPAKKPVEEQLKPRTVKQLTVRLLDGGVLCFRDYVSFEVRDGILYVNQRPQDVTEKVGSRQATVTSTTNIIVPMNRTIRLEDKLVVPKQE